MCHSHVHRNEQTKCVNYNEISHMSMHHFHVNHNKLIKQCIECNLMGNTLCDLSTPFFTALYDNASLYICNGQVGYSAGGYFFVPEVALKVSCQSGKFLLFYAEWKGCAFQVSSIVFSSYTFPQPNLVGGYTDMKKKKRTRNPVSFDPTNFDVSEIYQGNV